jgi:putative membrane protein
MIVEIAVRYIHFLSIFSLTSLLVYQNLSLTKKLEAHELRILSAIDALYGVSALAVLVSGLSLCFFVGKPSHFYINNIVFHYKVGLFLLVALMSVIPTVFFFRNRKITEYDKKVPKAVIFIKRVEVFVLLFIPLFAALMARGVGYS